MRLDVPDLDSISKENNHLHAKSSLYLTSLTHFLDQPNSSIELDPSNYADLKTKLDTLTESNNKLKQSLRIQSRNENHILHNSVLSSLHKTRSSSHNNVESASATKREAKIIEALDQKLKEAELALVKERESHKLQKRECRMIIEGLT